MDPVTHAAAASLLVATDRRRGADAGPWLPILGGLAPDIDAVFMPAGWDIYLRVHEAGTHSLAGVGLVAAGLAALFGWRAGRPFRSLYIPSLIAVASHVALDALSGATIKLGWPLLPHRSGFGLVTMLDPWFVAPVAIAVLLALTGRWRVAQVAPFALGVLTLLLAGKLVSRQAALAGYEPAHGTSVDARYVEPVRGSLTDWRIYDRGGGRIRLWHARAGGGAERVFDRAAVDQELAAHERRLGTVRNFLLAHELPVRVSVPVNDGLRVFWSDLRFCWSPGADGPAPGTTVRPADDPIACGVWFGGELAPDGQVRRQFVTIGDYVQER